MDSTGPKGAAGAWDPGHSSLVFNAMQINNQAAATPDTTQTLGSNAVIPSWVMSANPVGTRTHSLSFHVPEDFVNSATQTLVIVHFDTKQKGPTVDTGNVTIQLGALFVPIGGTIGMPCTTYTTTVAGVSSTTSNTTYNHYGATFALNQTIGPESFALLNVTRNATGDTYPDDVYLVTVEFRYLTG